MIINTWYLRSLLPESGVPNGKKNNVISSRVSTRGQKTFTLYKNGMFSYMVGLNDAESFHVGYSNYETV